MTTAFRTRVIRFLTVIPTVLLLGALAAPASAATLTIDGSGILTGATGVNVNGVFYDVSFVDGTCVDLFTGCNDVSDFQFQTEAAATAAAHALLDQVFIDTASGNFGSQPALTSGCGHEVQCSALIPFASGLGYVQGAHNINPSYGPDLVGFFLIGPFQDTSFVAYATYAVFSPAAAVPEPATLTLVGLGIAGLGLYRRRRRG